MLGQNVAGTVKGVVTGVMVAIAGALVAGVYEIFHPLRFLALVLLIVVVSFAFMAMMSCMVARMNNPMLPRAMFGVLNTLLYFPSGAVYPQQGFPAWMQAIAVVDPFTYSVHAFKSLLLRDTGLAAIGADLLFLVAFSALTMTAAALLFRRTL